MQLETISFCPVAFYFGEDTDPLVTPSSQGVVESNEVSPAPPFLQAKQPRIPQTHLMRLVSKQGLAMTTSAQPGF